MTGDEHAFGGDDLAYGSHYYVGPSYYTVPGPCCAHVTFTEGERYAFGYTGEQRIELVGHCGVQQHQNIGKTVSRRTDWYPWVWTGDPVHGFLYAGIWYGVGYLAFTPAASYCYQYDLNWYGWHYRYWWCDTAPTWVKWQHDQPMHHTTGNWIL